MRKNLPDKEFFIGKPLPGGMGHYVIDEYINSGGNAHMFRAYSSALNHYMACKIIPKANRSAPSL